MSAPFNTPRRGPKARAGKEWERLVGQALRHAGCKHNHNSNDEKPVCDWRSLVGNGRSLLVECKETVADRIPFSAISGNSKEGEFGHLSKHHAGGGLTLVLVSRVTTRRQAWACWFADWARLEDELGKPSASPKVRRAGHIRLDPPPECFVELDLVERGNGLGSAWDLGPVLGGAL